MNENKKTQYQIVKEFVADYENRLQPIIEEVQQKFYPKNTSAEVYTKLRNRNIKEIMRVIARTSDEEILEEMQLNIRFKDIQIPLYKGRVRLSQLEYFINR